MQLNVSSLVPIPTVEIQMVGDWKFARKYPDIVRECMSKGYKEGTEIWARDFLKHLLTYIGTRKRPDNERWPTLNDRYWSYGVGPKERILPEAWFFRTGALKRSMGITRKGNGQLMVGIKNPGSAASAGGISIGKAFGILQGGSVHQGWDGQLVSVPPRPFMEPLFQGKKGRDTLKNIIIREIRKQLFIRGIKLVNTSW